MAISKNKGPLLTDVLNGVLDLVPPKWRAKIGLTRTKQNVPIDVAVDPIAGNLVASELLQTLTDQKLKTNVILGDPTGKTMVEYIRTKDGQVGTRTLTYVPEGTALPTFDELTVDAGQEASGNGWSEQMFVTVPNLFGANDYMVELRDVTPPEFAALLQSTETSETVAGTAAMPTLGAGEYMRREQQITEQTKRVTVRARDIGSLPMTIVNKDTDSHKKVVTITKIWELDSTTPQTPTAIKDVKFEKLGDGTAVETRITIPAYFVGAVASKSILNLIPERLRANIPLHKYEFNVENSAIVSDPTLDTGEFEHTETQLDDFNKRVESTILDPIVGEIVAIDKGLTREFGGSVTTITHKFNISGSYTIDTGARVLRSEIIDLGNGYEIKTTEQADDATWTALEGQEFDERFNLIIPFTQQVKNAGSNIGDALTDIRPIDKWRQENKVIDIDAVQDFLDTYSLKYFGKVNVDLPDKLVSVDGVIQSDSGEGASDETGSNSVLGSYSISQALRATAQSSATLLPDISAVIKQFWGNNINCLNIHFFLPSPVTPSDVTTKLNALLSPDTITAWPKYNPEMVTIFLVGGRVSVQATASSQGSAAVSGSGSSSTAAGGTGYSREQGITLKTQRISPTIHDTIAVGGDTSDSVSVDATASAEAVGLGPAESETQSGSTSASVFPTTIPATEGEIDWPETGLFLYRVDAQPYRFGYIQFHCVVVDAADFPSNP